MLYVSLGVGGQVDFIRGAALGYDGLGKPILALRSVTTEGETSIVPFIKQGQIELLHFVGKWGLLIGGGGRLAQIFYNVVYFHNSLNFARFSWYLRATHNNF